MNYRKCNHTNTKPKLTMQKTTVIYHKADFDGLFCREIAKKFIPDATLIGWDYGDPEPVVPIDHSLFILDLSVPGLMAHPGLIWIDHHKSAIEKYPPNIVGYRIDGVAACRLAWQWFFIQSQWDPREMHPPLCLPSKDDFVDRLVPEPFAVRLAGEYDIWDKRDDRADLFQHGLRSQELTPEVWEKLLNSDATEGYASEVQKLLYQGKGIAFAKTRENESIIGKNGFTVHWEGLTFLACNASQYNSHLFTAGIKPEHEALLGFCLRANGKWTVSLYGVPHRPDLDLSVIAVKHGGGGHRQACGFTTDQLPFLPGHD